MSDIELGSNAFEGNTLNSKEFEGNILIHCLTSSKVCHAGAGMLVVVHLREEKDLWHMVLMCDFLVICAE